MHVNLCSLLYLHVDIQILVFTSQYFHLVNSLSVQCLARDTETAEGTPNIAEVVKKRKCYKFQCNYEVCSSLSILSVSDKIKYFSLNSCFA